MSYCSADEIWFLRQTVKTIQQELGGLARENIMLRGEVSTLKHRCNDYEEASISDLNSLHALETSRTDHKKQINHLNCQFLKMRGFHAKDYIANQELKKRIDEIDAEAIIEAMAMKKLERIATGTAEQVLLDY